MNALACVGEGSHPDATPAIFGRRRTSYGSGLGVFRWVVKRTLAWLHRFRRLAVRYERHDRVHHAFLTPGAR